MKTMKVQGNLNNWLSPSYRNDLYFHCFYILHDTNNKLRHLFLNIFILSRKYRNNVLCSAEK